MAYMIITLWLLAGPDWAAKLVEAGGKTNLSLAALIIIVLAFMVVKLFGKSSTALRVVMFLIMIICFFAFVFILVVPLPKKDVPPPDSAKKTQTDTPAPVPKQCTGSKSTIFTPLMPGVLQVGPDGQRIDLGDGGGGTRLYEWKVSWTAPAKVTSVDCTTGRNENRIGQPTKVGSTAECVGSTNGGNDAITLTVAWDGPCDQQ